MDKTCNYKEQTLKKLPHTPNSRIKSALRQLFLRSRERAKCLKDAEYRCAKCGTKQSRAKGKECYVEVHHKHGICNWEEIYKVVRKFLLCESSMMECLCKECHKLTSNENDKP